MLLMEDLKDKQASIEAHIIKMRQDVNDLRLNIDNIKLEIRDNQQLQRDKAVHKRQLEREKVYLEMKSQNSEIENNRLKNKITQKQSTLPNQKITIEKMQKDMHAGNKYIEIAEEIAKSNELKDKVRTRVGEIEMKNLNIKSRETQKALQAARFKEYTDRVIVYNKELKDLNKIIKEKEKVKEIDVDVDIDNEVNVNRQLDIEENVLDLDL